MAANTTINASRMSHVGDGTHLNEVAVTKPSKPMKDTT